MKKTYHKSLYEKQPEMLLIFFVVLLANKKKRKEKEKVSKMDSLCVATIF